MDDSNVDKDFPCSLTIHIPFPTHRLANAVLRTLAVDEELSPLVKRQFSLTASTSPDAGKQVDMSSLKLSESENRMLMVHYKATTSRMLRVATNGFFESLGVIVQTMEELDVDVVYEKATETLEGAQGIVQG